MKEIKIDTDFIKLDQFLKFANVVQSGGEAKMLIQDELVSLNGEVVVQRGKKIRKDDIIEIEGYDRFIVV